MTKHHADDVQEDAEPSSEYGSNYGKKTIAEIEARGKKSPGRRRKRGYRRHAKHPYTKRWAIEGQELPKTSEDSLTVADYGDPHRTIPVTIVLRFRVEVMKS